jgi:hypothetical protein
MAAPGRSAWIFQVSLGKRMVISNYQLLITNYSS